METLLNELISLGEIWKEEIEHMKSMEIEKRMRLYKKALEMIKRGFRITDLEWIIDDYS